MVMTPEEFLAHYGVKGMKWGVRNDLLRRGRKPPKKPSADRKKADELRKRGAKHLSNKQLKLIKERMELETSFDRLNPSKIEKGDKKVKELVALFGTAASVYAISKSPFGKKLMDLGKGIVEKNASIPNVATLLPPEAFIG